MAERRQLDDDVADGLSEDALLGTDSSFAAAYVLAYLLSLAERERAAARRAARRTEAQNAIAEARMARRAALERKEAETIAQLRHMASQRYG